MRRSTLVPAAVLALAACGAPSEPDGPPPLLSTLPRELSAGETGIARAANRFAFDLLREAVRDLPGSGNAFLSPLSASMVLAMTMNGAAGETREGMRAALRLDGLSDVEVNAGYRDYIALLRGLDPRVDMLVANSIWAAAGLPLQPAFSATGAAFFDAQVGTLDFGSPAAVETINAWVSERTSDRIPRLLETVEPDEVLFLINAIYFKGRWRAAFDREKTVTGTFHAADGVGRSASFMRMSEDAKLRYAGTERYQAVDLLYGNGAFAMTVVLPNPGETPASLLAGLDEQAWEDLVSGLREETVMLQLPRFRLEYGRQLDPDLSAVGMDAAFDPGRADFTGIADISPERFYISRVMQKTFVEVNEEGTEAAAATVVGMKPTSAPPMVTVDRPFLVAIRERFTGTILFLGQVNSVGS